MDAVIADVSSPAAFVALAAGVLWLPLLGFPTWPALARGRYASTVAISVGVGGAAYVLAQRLPVLAGS